MTHAGDRDAPQAEELCQLWLSPRTTPIWPVPRSSLEYQASSRLRELAAPRVRNNIWSINMSEVGACCPPALRGARSEGTDPGAGRT